MATTRIAFDAGSNEGRQVAEFVDAAMDAVAKGRRLRGQFLAMNSDAAAIEAELGGMVAGSGNDLWYILNVAITAIDSNDVAGLARLDQG